MTSYPERHHPVFFLVDALTALGAQVEFARDERTDGLWGFILNGVPVAWLIDNRWEHERLNEDPAAERLKAKGGVVYCAQKRDAERIGGRWLPIAATPGYRPIPCEKKHEVAFIGYVRDAARSAVLTDIAAHYTLALGLTVFGDDAVRLYCEAKVGVNVPTRCFDPLAYDINMRVTEIAATGTVLLTNDLPELAELGFIDGETCMTYVDTDELLDKLNLAMANPDLRNAIGRRGLALVNERHTYAHRAEQVLAQVGAGEYAHVTVHG